MGSVNEFQEHKDLLKKIIWSINSNILNIYTISRKRIRITDLVTTNTHIPWIEYTHIPWIEWCSLWHIMSLVFTILTLLVFSIYIHILHSNK